MRLLDRRLHNRIERPVIIQPCCLGMVKTEFDLLPGSLMNIVLYVSRHNTNKGALERATETMINT